MSRSSGKTFASDFRTFFVRGLGILLPSILTLGLLVWAFSILHRYVAEPINSGVRFLVIELGDEAIGVLGAKQPSWYEVTEAERAEFRLANGRRAADLTDAQVIRDVRVAELRTLWQKHWYLEAIGFLVAVVGVYLAGLFFGNLIGKRVYARVERFFVRLPVIKQVYPNVKQITDFLVGSDESKDMLPGSRVVVVEYPRKGIWTVGLLTGESMDLLETVAGTRLVTIFIPSSPTPFTGYTINVPLDDVREVDITLDEVIRFVVSGGVLVPPDRRPKRFREGHEQDEIKGIESGDRRTVQSEDNHEN